MSGLTEFDLIDTLLKPLSRNAPGAFSLTDDAAVLPNLSVGERLVVTKDALAEGVHFLPGDPPGDMARKALRTNLSDLAAMGAKPVGFLMALCLAHGTSDDFIKEFVAGLEADVDYFDLPLLGGDIIRKAGSFTVSITAIGSVRGEGVLRRSGGKVGDQLWVSGTIGDGALGLLAAREELTGVSEMDIRFLKDRYRVPVPRLDLGVGLVGLARSCIDVSDGLIADAGHLTKNSGIGCVIEQSAIPLSAAARQVLNSNPEIPFETVITGGDDYELMFSASPADETAVLKLGKDVDVSVHRIGALVDDKGVRVIDSQGNALEISQGGYQHL